MDKAVDTPAPAPSSGGDEQKHFTTEQCQNCGEIFECHCPRCHEWVTNPYIAIIDTLKAENDAMRQDINLCSGSCRLPFPTPL